nr:hypothetical protein [Tatlockia sp.]
MKYKEDWQGLINEYESSGLGQEEFCKNKGLPLAQFKYRWRNHVVQKRRQKAASLKSESTVGFEAVSLTKPVQQVKPRAISIVLPNQIRFELSLSYEIAGFGLVLKQ